MYHSHRRLGFPANQLWASLCLKLNLTDLDLLGCTGKNGYVDYLVFVRFLLEKTLRRGVEGVLEKHAGRLLLHVFLREQPVPHHR